MNAFSFLSFFIISFFLSSLFAQSQSSDNSTLVVRMKGHVTRDGCLEVENPGLVPVYEECILSLCDSLYVQGHGSRQERKANTPEKQEKCFKEIRESLNCSNGNVYSSLTMLDEDEEEGLHPVQAYLQCRDTYLSYKSSFNSAARLCPQDSFYLGKNSLELLYLNEQNINECSQHVDKVLNYSSSRGASYGLCTAFLELNSMTPDIFSHMFLNFLKEHPDNIDHHVVNMNAECTSSDAGILSIDLELATGENYKLELFPPKSSEDMRWVNGCYDRIPPSANTYYNQELRENFGQHADSAYPPVPYNSDDPILSFDESNIPAAGGSALFNNEVGEIEGSFNFDSRMNFLESALSDLSGDENGISLYQSYNLSHLANEQLSQKKCVEIGMCGFSKKNFTVETAAIGKQAYLLPTLSPSITPRICDAMIKASYLCWEKTNNDLKTTLALMKFVGALSTLPSTKIKTSVKFSKSTKNGANGIKGQLKRLGKNSASIFKGNKIKKIEDRIASWKTLNQKTFSKLNDLLKKFEKNPTLKNMRNLDRAMERADLLRPTVERLRKNFEEIIKKGCKI